VVGLFDRDVFIKLACCDLWEAALAATGITKPIRLASCTVSSSMAKVKKRLTDSALREATRARLERMVGVSEVVAGAEVLRPVLAELMRVADVDEGEALLFASLETLEDPSVFLTGDKRFLDALKVSFPERFAAARERILTFEGCLLRICQVNGVPYVVERLVPAAACDGVIPLALGGHNGADEQAFLGALRSFDPLRP
jgi:hypothetical protein